MSQPEEPNAGADGLETTAETGDELEGSEAVSLFDAEVEAPINAAVQHADADDRQGEGG